MKKDYQVPEVTINVVVLEQNFLASGENLKTKDVGDSSCFWE